GSIQYSILTSQEIIDMSEICLTEPQFYNPATKVPLSRGPLDLRMGLSMRENNQKCQTCQMDMIDCPGHFGYIKLVLPIFHVGFFTEIINILQCICKNCGEILLNIDEKLACKKRMQRAINEKNYQLRMLIYTKMRKECKKGANSRCRICDYKNGNLKKMPKMPTTISFQNHTKMESDFREIKKSENLQQENLRKILDQKQLKDMIQLYNPLQTFNLFKKIAQSDVILFNIDQNHPIDLILTHIIVPPSCIRPTIKEGESNVRHDDLTVKIRDFLERNKRIAQMINDGEDPSKINQEWFLLQCSHAHYLNAETPNLPFKMDKDFGKKDIRALAQRLKGKKGRFRGNLSGKRSNFTGRTVISPDPNIPIDNVVIPEYMAKILTFPETVASYNIDKLKKLVINGPDKYPGAHYIISKDTQDKFNLSIDNRRKKADELKIGDVVERHIQNGEIVLFNRQPSLHRISIMAFKANIQKWNTLRFNECCCAPFNADFDGDEMNIHVPQTIEARAEAQYLLDVKQNLISPKNGETIIALVQDFLTASYLITHKDMFFDRAAFSQLCTYFSDGNEQIQLPPPAVILPVEMWTGKQAIDAMLIPNRKNKIIVNLTLKEKCYNTKKDREIMCPKDGYVVFQNSELLCGNLGKTTLGSGNKNGLFYRLSRDNSQQIAAAVMTRFAKLSARWLSNYGMTIGISDVTPSPQLNEQNEKQKDEAIQKCTYESKKFEREINAQQKLHTTSNTSEIAADKKKQVEAFISKTLNQVREDIGSNCNKELPPTNGPLIMATCGSKGSATNLSQMIGCVGQQIIGGKRVPNGFTGRTLPHFAKDEIFPHPEAMGFVRNSFFTGLSAPEFFFHTMAGRESLVDTAVKTADTGYMSRRLVKMLEDLSINYDLTVRTCDKKELIQFRYGGDGICPWMSEEKVSDKSVPVDLYTVFKNVKSIIPNRDGQKSLLPFQIMKITLKQLQNVKMDYIPELKINKNNQLQINEINNHHYQSDNIHIQKLLSDTYKEDSSSIVKEPLEYFKDSVFNFIRQICLKIIKVRQQIGLTRGDDELTNNESSIHVDNSIHITEQQLMFFFKLIWERYPQMLVEPGEAVGAIGATSISEPATQMTLKSFHFAGIASMNITQGVPRMKEIIDAAKNISTPVIDVKLLPEYQTDEYNFRSIRLQIEKTYLGEICEFYKEAYSPKDCHLHIQLNQQQLEKYRTLGLQIPTENIIKGILETAKDIKMEQIVEVKEQGSHFSTALKIYPTNDLKKNVFFKIQNWKKILPTAVVSGMKNVKRVNISKDKKKNEQHYKFDLFVEGNALKQILMLEKVDFSSTSTVDIYEVFEVLGIEAARKTIINEITKTIKSHSLNVDTRHLVLVADVLTSKGRLYGSTRQGINFMKDSTLMLASFEKTTEILYNAALQGRKDLLEGVSERIIIGQNIPMGTGTFNVLYGNQINKNQKGKYLIKSKLNFQPLFNEKN
ncbi:hypothetical protein IMG5_137010, partial [Ichthyophthirius multifiliis]